MSPDESHSERLSRKVRDAPMMLVGIAGLLAVCALGAYKFKRRGTMPVSQFLMQLRVAAQGAVVAALTAGAVYSMVSSHADDDEDKKDAKATRSKR